MEMEEDVVENVVSALDDFAKGKITWDELDIRLHDKRYHPRGYKDSDTCKYRDLRLKIKKDSPSDMAVYEVRA